MLDIIPGVYRVPSAYHIDEVNFYSQKVIRYAMWLCCFNVALAILRSAAGSVSAVIDSLFSIILNVLILFMAVRCVRSKNSICCCGLSALSFYRYFLMIQIFFTSLAIIIYIAVLSSGDVWATISLVYYLILFILYFAQLRFSNKVMNALTAQVQPLPTTAAVRTTATPTTAVVQTSPSYAAIEIDANAGQGQRNNDPNGYGR
jgi:hypothetical protein